MSSTREAFPSERNSSTAAKSLARDGQSMVLQDLERLGPNCIHRVFSIADSEKYCKNLALNHYENFSVASFLVPKSIRQDFYNVYAYCRWSDDLADETGAMESKTTETVGTELLRWWRDELVACFEGRVRHPVFVALRTTIQKHDLNWEPFHHLLEAFIQDQRVNRFESDQEIFEYCSGSANPVGRILLRLAKVDGAAELELSDSICTGLQIANFCQDIQRDALRNRIYLPKTRWNANSLSEQEILAGHATENLKIALSDWVDYARQKLIAGLPLVRSVPRWLARDLQLFARGGLTLLENIQRADFDIWRCPIEVSKQQKLNLLFRSILFPRSVHYPFLPKPMSRTAHE